MKSKIIILGLFPFLLFAQNTGIKMSETHEGSKLLYLIYHGKTEEALESYLTFCHESGGHDLELLQQCAMQILEQGSQSNDPEEQLLAIFGAGISANTALIPILERGLESSSPMIQLASLNFLGRLQDDEADELMFSALSSQFLLIRLEAVFHLAQKRHPLVLTQVESLMYKMPDAIKSIFPQIIAAIDNPSATKILRQFFTDTDSLVRIETVLHVAQTEQEDLLPQIRALATHPNVAEQEVCAAALGLFRDEQSINLLCNLANSPVENVCLAACFALYQLGHHDKINSIIALAKRKQPFAIALLGEIQDKQPEIRELLLCLMKDEDLNIRTNATIALLKRKDPHCIDGLKEIFIHDARDLIFHEQASSGHALKAWRAVSCFKQKAKDNAQLYEKALHIKESILKRTVELPENTFIQIAKMIFTHRQYDLVPTVVELLRSSQSPAAIALLKSEYQKTGAPLIRGYCNLALFRMQEPGPYEDNLKKWILDAQKADLIRFRDVVPRSQSSLSISHLLTPEETSRLLVESFEALASCQNEAGIEAIVKAIAYGNPKNKYALAGLLLKTTE